MTQNEYNNLNQEIIDVMLYNKQRSERDIKAITEYIHECEAFLRDIDAVNEEAEQTLDDSKETINDLVLALARHNIRINLPGPESDQSLEPENDYFMPDPDDLFAAPEMSWDDIVKAARESGIHDTTIHDLLSDEEMVQSKKEYADIAKAFNDKVRLTKKDWAMVILAVILQVIRQYFITSIDLDDVTASAKDAEKAFKDKYNKGGKLNNKYYYANIDCILKYKTVPYDVMKGGKDFNFAGKDKGASGNNHRYYTLGHDPILYAVFGTANILTNTITRYDGKTYHVKYAPNAKGVMIPSIVNYANTGKMFDWTLNRIERSGNQLVDCIDDFKSNPSKITEILFDEEKRADFIESFAPVAAFIKARMHLKSDKSVNGLTIPFLEIFTSPEKAMELSQYGYNAANLNLVIKGIAKQAAGSIFINFIIGMIHGYLCRYEEGIELIYTQVRTRKVLLISNLIASSSNVVAMAVLGIVSAYTQNVKAAEFAYKHTDVGGAIVTLYRTFTDLDFIERVRDEFIKKQMDVELSKIFDKLNEFEEDIKRGKSPTV